MRFYSKKFSLILVLLFSLSWVTFAAAKMRVIHTTDLGGDDHNTLIRALLFANDQKILGILTSSSPWGDAQSHIQDIFDKIDLYAQVYDNLKQHDSSYPTPDYLRSITKPGNSYNDFSYDTEGSMLIVNALLDHSDDSPIWVTTWGGASTVTAALRYINDHYPNEKDYVANKLKIDFIAVTLQGGDDTYSYIQSHYPTLQMYDTKVYQYMTRPGNPTYWADNVLYSSLDWINDNIKNNHGALCSSFVYDPTGNGEFDGDGPSVLLMLSQYYGLRSCENPAWGGWGSRFSRVKTSYGAYNNELQDYYRGEYYDGTWTQQACYTGSRWADAFQNEMAVRADWCVKSYADANHPPSVELNIPENLFVKAGDTVNLSANATDPEGDTLSYHWWQYKEAGTSSATVTITDADSPNASFVCPNDSIGKTLHFILEVNDNGKGAPITRYARVVVTISETTTTPTIADSSKPLVKIVTIGDSITELKNGHNSYRYWLWNMLKVNGYNIDFVGSHAGVYDGTPKYSNFDQDNEGHWGWRTDEVRDNLSSYLQGYTPDIALIHLGHNDLIQDQSVASTIAEIEDIIDILRQSNPQVTILLAKIIPSSATWYAGLNNIPEFNSQLQNVVNDKSNSNSPVILVDQNSGIDPVNDLFDSIHPNETGEVKMANKWYDAIKAVLNGEIPPPPEPSDDLLLEAEDAAEIYGANIAGNQAGFSGSGFVDYVDASGAYVKWNFNIDSAGSYKLKFGYALAYGDRPLEIKVNGAVVEPSLSFPATGSFTTWGETAEITVSLQAGTNTITATAIGSSGANVDYLKLTLLNATATRLEAEDAAAVYGANIASNQAGFSGSGFVDYIDAAGAYVEWEVNAQTAGDYNICFGYALASGDRPLEIKVNGTVVEPSLSFPATGSFTTWGETSLLTVTLNAGVNTVRATAIGSSGANVDYLDVIPIATVTTTLEAEDASEISGATISSYQSGFSGSGYVDYDAASGAYVKWEVNAESAGNYRLKFGYALASGDRPLEIKVNGTIVEPSLSFPATGSWTTWGETAEITVTLQTGVNTVTATAIGSSGANVDYIKIIK